MNIIRFIFQSLYFALPMYMANIAPVLLAKVPVFATPLDFGKTWRGQPILGPHKTWRGLLAGIIFGVLSVYVQAYLAEHFVAFRRFGLIDYQRIQPLILGFLFGFGALLGDAVKSLFKRRFAIRSGQPWVPFDQIDFVLGGLILSVLYVWPGLVSACVILLFTPFLHLGANLLAFRLGIKSVPW